jgi:hypothetical protein
MTYFIQNYMIDIISIWPLSSRILCVTQPIPHCTTPFITKDGGSMFFHWYLPTRLHGVKLKRPQYE